MPYEFKIDDEYSGISPKNFLKKKLDISYNQIFIHIKNKRITINGKKIKNDMKMKKGDIIKVWLDSIPKREEIETVLDRIEPKNLGMKTIFENKDFLVLNKLSGVVVQGAPDNESSLSYHLEFLRRKNKDKTQYFHVHRLDKETSGVLICSKDMASRRILNEVFKKKDMKKVYVCLCEGKFTKKSGKVECKLDRTPPETREKVVVSDIGKDSLSLYKVINEFNFEGEKLSLVEVEIKTGITHQIRVHMKSLGHPIVGDRMYGNSYINNKFKRLLDRQFLHAKEIDFEYEGKKYSFKADYTDDLNDVLRVLKKTKS